MSEAREMPERRETERMSEHETASKDPAPRTIDTAAVGCGPAGAESEAERDRAWVQQLREQSAHDDAEAMYLLGVCHARGRGVAADPAAAAEWFRKAALLGHLKAKVSLGYCYAAGMGVKRDLEIAYVLLREAADAGDRDAFELAERVARRLHGEQLARLEKKIRQRRILARANRLQMSANEEIVL